MALKAHPDEQARLLDLQALDTRLGQLDHRAKALPESAQVQALTSEANALRMRRAGELGQVDDAEAELKRTESDVAVVEARIARDAARLQASSSVKDVAGLESELAGLRRRLDELEEIELAVMERVEALAGVASASEREQAELTSRLSSSETARDAALDSIRSERQEVTADRASIANALPAELIALYERQRSRYGFGASLLRAGVSSASGVKLHENELAVVRSAADDDVLICPDSQAILVRTPESGLFGSAREQ